MKAFQISFFLIFLFTACADETETQAEITAKKLQADIRASGANIVSISVVNIYDGTPIFTGSSYVIKSDGFIVVTNNDGDSITFNLGELKSYVINSISLALYY